MLKRLQSVYYVVEDMDRAVAFYQAVFGMTLKFRDGDRWAQFDAGGANFALSSREESASLEGGAVTAFEVDDIEACAARLAAQGATLLARRDMGSHGATASFRDSEGNIVQLFAKAS